MKYEFEYLQYSERAILIRNSSEIDENLLQELIFFKNMIEIKYNKVIVEVINSYNSLLIYYISTIENFYSAVLELKSLYLDIKTKKTIRNKCWEIPVCYDVALVPEIEVFAAHKSMTISDVISLHTAPLYTVYFLGFLPGFMYLGGLDDRLITPRKTAPSLHVKKGSVAIGGNQTGVYPYDSPGGWHVIGRSPISFFDVHNAACCFVSPNDKIKFISIKEKKYNDISVLVSNNLYTVKPSFV